MLIVAAITNKILPAAVKIRLSRALCVAGKDMQWSVDMVFFCLVASIPISLVAGLIFFGNLTNFPISMFMGPAIIYFWILRMGRKRQEAIRIELPQFMDLLVLSLRAGSDFATGVERITTRLRSGVLKEELERILAELRMGYDRVEIFKRFGERTQIGEVRELANTLKQAQQFGTGISDVVEAQSSRLRTKRMERAMKAGLLSQQMLVIPLVIFFMPITFVIIFAPLIVRFFYGGLEAFL